MINDRFISQLKSQVNRMPNKPGVYIMSNDQGKVIYVGKAKGLKNRVRSYFTPKPASDKVEAILKEIKTIDTTVTITERGSDSGKYSQKKTQSKIQCLIERRKKLSTHRGQFKS